MAGPWIIGKYAYSALVRDDMTADELKKGEHETVDFKQDILSFGDTVEVLEPLALRSDIASIIRNCNKMYM